MSDKNMIPCCYFPTTPMMIDDDYDFLQGLIRQMHRVPNPYAFTDPIAALDFVTRRYVSLLSLNHYSANRKTSKAMAGNAELHARALIDIDVLSIHQLLYKPERFRELAVAIVDYSMSGLDGVEFFDKVLTYPFQKILLTGFATHSIGLEAFNHGAIDQFAEKSISVDFEENLNRMVRQFERRYFEKCTENIFYPLSNSKDSCLGESRFTTLFNKMIQKYKIVEYYLVSDTGCFLMIDFAGRCSWLAVKSEDDMRFYEETAVKNNAPSSVIHRLKSREHVLFLFSREDDEEVTYDEWDAYLHPAKKFEGKKNTFYYAYITGNALYDDQLGPFISYKDFLTKE